MRETNFYKHLIVPFWGIRRGLYDKELFKSGVEKPEKK
jgi:hypothetical protein